MGDIYGSLLKTQSKLNLLHGYWSSKEILQSLKNETENADKERPPIPV